jgi:hypothetical protein
MERTTMRKLGIAVLCLLCACGTSLLAQDAALPSSPAAPKGIVTGHIFCADTGLPARFATLQLQPEKEPNEPKLDSKKIDFTAILAKVMKGNGLSTLTRLDGSFRLENVPPGIYYAIPQLAGYLSPFGQLSSQELMKDDSETRKQIQSHAQKVMVEAGHAANIELRLERGAAISGEILYDDGTPAANVMAHLMLKQKDGTWKPFSPSMSGVTRASGATDDHGRFRLAGLPAGDYGVMSELPVTQVSTGSGLGSFSMQMHPSDALQVFSGNVFRQSEMKDFTLGVGEELAAVDLIFPVNGLFRVAGTVVAKRDSHLVNTGAVELLDPVDKSNLRTGIVANDGSFSFEYVPDGEYLLKVTGAADVNLDAKPEKLPGGLEVLAALPGVGDAMRKHSHEYGSADLPLSVHGETAGISVAVPELPAKTEVPASLQSPLRD